MGDFEINNNEIFDTNSLTFDTGNPVCDGLLNVGVRVGIGILAVVAGNAVYYGGKKGFEALGTKIDEAKAAAQAAQTAAQQAIAQQQAAPTTAIPQQAPQAQPGQPIQQAPFDVVNPDGTVVSAGHAPQNVQTPQQAPQVQPQMQAAPQQ